MFRYAFLVLLFLPPLNAPRGNVATPTSPNIADSDVLLYISIIADAIIAVVLSLGMALVKWQARYSDELQRANEALQSAYEKTHNEKEELQRANEALQSAYEKTHNEKEALQRDNEKLHDDNDAICLQVEDLLLGKGKLATHALQCEVNGILETRSFDES